MPRTPALRYAAWTRLTDRGPPSPWQLVAVGRSRKACRLLLEGWCPSEDAGDWWYFEVVILPTNVDANAVDLRATKKGGATWLREKSQGVTAATA